MQVPHADLSQSKRVGVDEQFIKFRSSPNFKVMKKFIRSKIDKTETSPNNLPDPQPPPNLEASVQPDPLPAPDALESISDAPDPKVDNADVGHEDYLSPLEEVKKKNSVEEPGKTPEYSIMCRDFIRGTCKRPGTCKYAHKCDKTQLFGVYTFCRNFQNKICTLPNCKYVHASVFEEQEFYRSGKLPPHVLTPKCPPPPPPPPPPPSPPPPPEEPESRLEIPTSFSNPPPMLPPSVLTNSSGYPCLPSTSATEQRIFHEEFAGAAGAARDAYAEPPPKKCKNCDTMDIRVRCHNELLEKKREAIEDWKRKSNEMDIKKEKMSVILRGLLKLAKNSPSSSGASSLFNTGGNDKNKILLDQLIKLSSGNRISVGTGDNSSPALLGDNFGLATMIANLLSEHQPHPVDAGRRE